MIYTENNIDGVQFKTCGEEIIYTISQDKGDSYKFSWKTGSQLYHKSTIIKFLNDRLWIPINRNFEFSLI